ncbi:hypothetical protein M0R04_14680 [Candidatus Dojkabacteria bacterium]|jgi:hypothetical protein|nr:hypothetical protein [Candidatus Dojkabacteria bacterium]
MNKCKRCFHEDKYHDERGCHHYYEGDKTVCLCLKYTPIPISKEKEEAK